MLGPHKLIIDTWAEVYDLLRPYADGEFWQFSDVEFDPDAHYIIGRLQIRENWATVTDLAARYPGRIIFCNPAEGSQTILLQLKRLRIWDQVRQGHIRLLTSGDMEPGFDPLLVDCYFSNIVTYDENVEAALQTQRIYTNDKPWDFLFLNGRLRPHRKYLIDLLRQRDLLDRALWTCLQTQVDMPWSSQLQIHQSTEELRLLPAGYEIDRAEHQLGQPPPDRDVKHWLFNNTWGDAVVNPRPYVETCFSVVTETIYDYPYTFRTEKIWKPILMGHPWIAVANHGYYRDLRAQGFKTFDSLIDESFDLEPDATKRMHLIADAIKEIIDNGSRAFLTAAEHICKYNQQRLQEYNQEQRAALPFQLQRYLHGRP